jgi:hypothetical protein
MLRRILATVGVLQTTKSGVRIFLAHTDILVLETTCTYKKKLTEFQLFFRDCKAEDTLKGQ